MPFWSPDGKQIGYRAEDSLWRIPVGGGPPTLITGEAPPYYPASWGDDEMIVYSTIEEIHEVPARGGEPKSILQKNPETERHFHGVYQLPGGRGLLVVVHHEVNADTITLWADGERRKLLTLMMNEDFIENVTPESVPNLVKQYS